MPPSRRAGREASISTPGGRVGGASVSLTWSLLSEKEELAEGPSSAHVLTFGDQDEVTGQGVLCERGSG